MSSTIFEMTARAVLASGCSIRFRAHGSSMAPAILSGDYLHVRANADAIPHVEDIVLVNLERGLTAHRVIAVACDRNGQLRIVTRGDNAASPDAPFALSQIVGVVSGVERDGSLRSVDVQRLVRKQMTHGWVRRVALVQRGFASLWPRST